MLCINTNCHFITTRGFNAYLIFLAFSAVHIGAHAEVIGVDLSGNSAQDASADDSVVDLLDPVMRLNRFIFDQTILEEHADEVPHWIVLFCPPWYEPCQALEPAFQQMARKWQEQLNGALLSTEVRFAAVDCATEKALCNTQNVNTYPFVAHYRQRKQVSKWRGKSLNTDAWRLGAYLEKELGPVAAMVLAATGTQDSSSEPMQDATAEGGMSIPVDFLLIFAAIAGNAFFISRGGSGAEASSPMASTAKPPMGGIVLSSGLQAEQRASCVARSLPKEWGHDRPSLEL